MHVFARLFVAVMLVSPAWADVVEQGPKDSPPSGLLVGVARADIAPPVGVAQMNWGSQTHVEAIGVDPVGMKATAIVFSDGDQRFAMVDIDRLFINGLEGAITEASRLTGIPESHIRLAATHTHAGAMVNAAKGPAGMDLTPLVDMAERYRLFLVDKIVGVIVQANSQLEPAHIAGGRGEGTINVNRRVRAHGNNPAAVGRNTEGYNDRDLIVFRIDNAKGEPLAVLANYPCHGTVLAYENKFISPDWVGTMRETVEAAMPGALALFFQGAAGNQGPVEGFTGDLEVAHRLGRILGHQIASVALQLETVQREPTFEGFVESTAYQAKQHWRVKGPRPAELKFTSTVVDVPRRTYSRQEIAGMKDRLATAQGQLDALGTNADPWKRLQAGARVRRFGDLLKNWTQPVDPTPRQVEIQALQIGDLALVAMPGEPFAEIGAAVRDASPYDFTMFCGYSDGIGGDYMPTADEYQHGGYEVERTLYDPGADEVVVEAASALLRSLRHEQ